MSNSKGDLNMAPIADTVSHLSAEDAAGFLDGRLSREVNARIEKHLAACRECRDDLGASARLLPASRISWPIVRIVTGIAAAALITIVIRSATLSGGAPDQQRAGQVDLQPLAQSPADGALVPAGHVVLTWSFAVAQSSYRVTVTDSLGSTVWSAESRDTVVSLPNSVRLVAGDAYYWYVEALLPDGRRRSSGVQRIRIQ